MAALLLFGLAVFFFSSALYLGGSKFTKYEGDPRVLGLDLSERLSVFYRFLALQLIVTSVGWIAMLREFGDIFDLTGFYILHLIMAIVMCVTWTVLFVLTVMAFYKGYIFKSMSEDVIKDSALFKHDLEKREATVPCLNSHISVCLFDALFSWI